MRCFVRLSLLLQLFLDLFIRLSLSLLVDALVFSLAVAQTTHLPSPPKKSPSFADKKKMQRPGCSFKMVTEWSIVFLDNNTSKKKKKKPISREASREGRNPSPVMIPLLAAAERHPIRLVVD